MYIDSPNFVKRKILQAQDLPYGDASGSSPHSKASGWKDPFEFGSERRQLIQYVNSSLNSHERDEEILERFRREAEELKRKKYESKRGKNQTYVINRQGTQQLRKSGPKIVPQMAVNPQTAPFFRQPMAIVEQQFLESALRNEQSHLLNKYEKLLHSKDKQLRKKDKLLHRSRLAIEKMSKKLKYLQDQKISSALQEERELEHMNDIIQEVGSKVVENKIKFREEIDRLRYQLRLPQEEGVERKVGGQGEMRTTKPKKKTPINFKHLSEKGLIPQPSIVYDIPSEPRHHYTKSNPINLDKLPKYPPYESRSLQKPTERMALRI